MPTLLGVSKVRLKVPSLSPMKASWRQQKTRWLVGWVGFLLFDGNQKSGFNSPVEVDRGKGSWNLPLCTDGFYNISQVVVVLGFLKHQQYHPMESFQNLKNVLMIFWRLRVEALLKNVPCIWNGFAGEFFPLPKPHVPRIKADIGLMGVFSVVGIHRTEYIRWHDMLDGYPP